MKKILSRATIALLALSIFSLCFTPKLVLAEEYTVNNSLTSLYDDKNPEGLIDSLDPCKSNPNYEAMQKITYSAPEAVISKVYWSELEQFTVPTTSGDYYGVLPKYLLKPSETALGQINYNYSDSSTPTNRLISSGISANAMSLASINYWFWKEFGYYNGADEADDTNCPNDTCPDNYCKQPVKEKYNPYKFTENELLTVDEIKNSGLLYTTADIMKDGSSDSKAIDEYEPESELKLNFSFSADWFKRFINGFTLMNTRGGFRDKDEIQEVFNSSKGKCDAQIVYTLDLPNSINTDSVSCGLNARNNTFANLFDNIATKVELVKDAEDKVTSKKLIISLRLKEAIRGEEKLWQNIINTTRNLDLSNVVLNISGLKLMSDCEKGKNITLKATLSGMYDWYYQSTNSNSHYYMTMAAKQSPAGLDSAASKDKPNLISYTFKVKDEPSNDKIVTFINDGKFYDLVLVRADTAIKDNYSAVMPADASKEGYIFKEWNTKEDGTGTAFTNETVVHTDMTVYAIYTKKPDMVIPYVPSDPVEPATVETVVEPKVGKVAKTGETAISLTGFGLVLSLVAVLTKKKQNDD